MGDIRGPKNAEIVTNTRRKRARGINCSNNKEVRTGMVRRRGCHNGLSKEVLRPISAKYQKTANSKRNTSFIMCSIGEDKGNVSKRLLLQRGKGRETTYRSKDSLRRPDKRKGNRGIKVKVSVRVRHVCVN